jgi:hypothetical protein
MACGIPCPTAGRSSLKASLHRALSDLACSSKRRPQRDSSSRAISTSGVAYTGSMQLHVARLCLDCNEVHDIQRCPVCGSEAFAYLTRWVPAPERRLWTRPTTSPDADVYRELIAPASSKPQYGRLLKRSALGVTAIAMAGWVWRWNEARKKILTSSPDPTNIDRGNQTP